MSRVLGAAVDVVAVAVTFALLGAAGALLWHHQVQLPSYARTADGEVLDQVQLAKLVGIDGWFAVIALAGGLVAGIALTWWRSRRPVLLVLLLAAGGLLAAWVMLHLGQRLGPDDPRAVLAHLAQGARAPVPLTPHAGGIAYVWPMAALLGAAFTLLGGHDPATKGHERRDDAVTAG